MANAEEASPSLPIPFFIFPCDEDNETHRSTPVITGETPNNTTIEIFFDNESVGMAEVINGPLFTAGFSFQLTQPLSSGEHEVQAKAVSEMDENMTSQSVVQKFNIGSNPAPVIKTDEYTEDMEMVGDNVSITGWAKSGSAVRVYVDDQAVDELTPPVHESGVSGFTHRVAEFLSAGEHRLHLTAISADGGESQPSEALEISVIPFTPAPVELRGDLSSTQANQPIISGLVKNGLKVKISSDEIGETTIEPTEHPSGTTAFQYQVASAMPVGDHIIKVQSIDNTDKASVTQDVMISIFSTAGSVAADDAKVLGESSKANDTTATEDSGEEATKDEDDGAEPGTGMSSPDSPDVIADQPEGGGENIDDVASEIKDEEAKAKRQRNIVIGLLIIIIIIAGLAGNKRKTDEDESGDGKKADGEQKSLWDDKADNKEEPSEHQEEKKEPDNKSDDKEKPKES